MNAHTLPPFRSRRVKECGQVILELLAKKPRTTDELARAIGRDVMSTGTILGRMAEGGLIVRAEQRCNIRIWEAVK